MAWIVEYYRDAKGREPVAEFIDALPIGTQAKVFRLIDLLARYHVLLKEPYAKQIKGKLRELRVVYPTPRVCQENEENTEAQDRYCGE